MPIEVESPEELGYDTIRYNLSESSITDLAIADLNVELPSLTLLYGAHRGSEQLRSLIVGQQSVVGAQDVLITSGAAGALFISAATAVLLLNVLFRIGVEGDKARDREEDARRYFDEHGRWPGE